MKDAKLEKQKFNTALIIDDNEMDLMIAEWSVNRAFGIKEENIYKKREALKAIDFLRSIDNKEELPDIIILDIRMPEIDGFEFLREFVNCPNQITSHCKILLASAYFSEYRDLFERSKNYPFLITFIDKPLSPEKLHEILIMTNHR